MSGGCLQLNHPKMDVEQFHEMTDRRLAGVPQRDGYLLLAYQKQLQLNPVKPKIRRETVWFYDRSKGLSP
ncbi:hypothetical protein BW716_06285 [[Flexibacter] sp. ATCC 35208]|nr:hypothetical protein BW716_06285 [[Flexibacter] sp. ATCC 35208]